MITLVLKIRLASEAIQNAVSADYDSTATMSCTLTAAIATSAATYATSVVAERPNIMRTTTHSKYIFEKITFCARTRTVWTRNLWSSNLRSICKPISCKSIRTD